MKIAPIAALALAASLLSGSAAIAAPGGDGKGGPKDGPKEGQKDGPKDDQKDWSSHKGNIPFIIGREAGMKEAEFTGKPILFFYTATW
jgi:hypothetical protein